jgi:hypothetical protein
MTADHSLFTYVYYLVCCVACLTAVFPPDVVRYRPLLMTWRRERMVRYEAAQTGCNVCVGAILDATVRSEPFALAVVAGAVGR